MQLEVVYLIKFCLGDHKDFLGYSAFCQEELAVIFVNPNEVHHKLYP